MSLLPTATDFTIDNVVRAIFHVIHKFLSLLVSLSLLTYSVLGTKVDHSFST
jgi:hypothetical protein